MGVVQIRGLPPKRQLPRAALTAPRSSPLPPQFAIIALALAGTASAGNFSTKSYSKLEAVANKTGAVKAEAIELVEAKLNHTIAMADKVMSAGDEKRGARGVRRSQSPQLHVPHSLSLSLFLLCLSTLTQGLRVQEHYGKGPEPVQV